MLKKTITYTDFDGNTNTEDFYFNLTKAELIEMEISVEGGFQKKIDDLVKAQNTRELMNIFKDIILRSYGEKSADGKRFVKSKELSEAFAQTEAYSALFMEFFSDSDAAAKFINGIVPSDVAAAVEQNRIDAAKAKANIESLNK